MTKWCSTLVALALTTIPTSVLARGRYLSMGGHWFENPKLFELGLGVVAVFVLLSPAVAIAISGIIERFKKA